jgi:hypothetical protein
MTVSGISKDSIDNTYMERLYTEDPHIEKRVLPEGNLPNQVSDGPAGISIADASRSISVSCLFWELSILLRLSICLYFFP